MGKSVVVDGRTDGGLHVLPACKAVNRRTRLQTDAANRGIQLAQPPRCSHKRAAGAQSGDKMRDAPAGLLPNFICRAAIVRLPVRWIAVLIRVKIFLRLSRYDLLHAANPPFGAFIART